MQNPQIYIEAYSAVKIAKRNTMETMGGLNSCRLQIVFKTVELEDTISIRRREDCPGS